MGKIDNQQILEEIKTRKYETMSYSDMMNILRLIPDLLFDSEDGYYTNQDYGSIIHWLKQGDGEFMKSIEWKLSNENNY